MSTAILPHHKIALHVKIFALLGLDDDVEPSMRIIDAGRALEGMSMCQP
jgi:hypothetical protein